MRKFLIFAMLLITVGCYSQSSKFKSIVLKPTEQPGNPTEGELYYDSTQDSVYLYTGSAWISFGYGTGGVSNGVALGDSGTIYYTPRQIDSLLTIFGLDSFAIESIDGDDVLVFYNGSDTIMPYIPYAYRSSGALTSREITDAQDTLELTDQSKFIYMNRGSAQTLLIPANASRAFPVDTEIVVLQWGAGATSIGSMTSAVLINGAAADTVSISAQYKPVTLKKKATNTWVIFGGL